jgi:acid phosphatase type 7
VYKGKCQTPGFVVVNLGMAGAGNSNDLQPDQPDMWVYVDDSHHGYTRIYANATTYTQEYVHGNSRKVHDSFTLTK